MIARHGSIVLPAYVFVSLCFEWAPLSHGQTPRNLVPPPDITEVKTLAQNWSNDDAGLFYNTPQGSKLIPFTWFLYLEQPDKNVLFRDAEYIRALGYLPRTKDSGNPYGLPVGFVKDGVHLGLTCEACHTTQIVYQKKVWMIDGAPTLGDFDALLRRLTESLKATIDSDEKFKRFASNVLGTGASDDDRAALLTEMKRVLALRQGYNARNLSHDGSPTFGPGRIDAFGAIMNEVSSTFAGLPDNFASPNAPVSYPFLWDTPQHDFVQWNGAAANFTTIAGIPFLGTKYVGGLGRNAGEVMGVFGTVQVVKDGIIIPATYPSSVNLPHLIDIEELLRELWSPLWPSDFPPVVEEKRAKGESLFLQHCAKCHQSIKRDDPARTVKAWLEKSVGTDPSMAKNFLVRKAKTGAFQGQKISVLGLRRFQEEAPVASLLTHTVERVLLGGGTHTTPSFTPFNLAAPVEINLGDKVMVGRFQSLELEKNRFVAGLSSDKRTVLDLVVRQDAKTFKLDPSKVSAGRFLATDNSPPLTLDAWSPHSIVSTEGSLVALKEPAPVSYIYKGRPLNGIWATAPYLHNGSVPNLDELLKKPAARMTKFRVGSREFDPDKVGFRTDMGSFEFDTTQPGNFNVGHDYDVEFTPDQREQLIHYMKSL